MRRQGRRAQGRRVGPTTAIRDSEQTYITDFDDIRDRPQRPGVSRSPSCPRTSTSRCPPWAAELPALGAVDDASADSPTASTEPGAVPPATSVPGRQRRRPPLSGTAARLDRRRHHRRHREHGRSRHHRRLMRAVVLVGGFGTRLRPLTNTRAQVDAAGRPRADHRAPRRRLGRGGVTDVTLALGFLPEPFVDAFPDGRCGGVALRYAVEPEPLDTAGAIRFAADARRHRRHVRRRQRRRAHRPRRRRPRRRPPRASAPRRRSTSRRSTTRRRSGSSSSTATVASALRREAGAGDDRSNLINAGTYVFEPACSTRIPAGRRVSIERETFPAARRRRVAVRHGHRRLLDRRRPPRAAPAGQPRSTGRALRRRPRGRPGRHVRRATPTPTVHRQRRRRSSSVDRGATIGAGATRRAVGGARRCHHRRGRGGAASPSSWVVVGAGAAAARHGGRRRRA